MAAKKKKRQQKQIRTNEEGRLVRFFRHHWLGISIWVLITASTGWVTLSPYPTPTQVSKPLSLLSCCAVEFGYGRFDYNCLITESSIEVGPSVRLFDWKFNLNLSSQNLKGPRNDQFKEHGVPVSGAKIIVEF